MLSFNNPQSNYCSSLIITTFNNYKFYQPNTDIKIYSNIFEKMFKNGEDPFYHTINTIGVNCNYIENIMKDMLSQFNDYHPSQIMTQSIQSIIKDTKPKTDERRRAISLGKMFKFKRVCSPPEIVFVSENKSVRFKIDEKIKEENIEEKMLREANERYDRIVFGNNIPLCDEDITEPITIKSEPVITSCLTPSLEKQQKEWDIVAQRIEKLQSKAFGEISDSEYSDSDSDSNSDLLIFKID